MPDATHKGPCSGTPDRGTFAPVLRGKGQRVLQELSDAGLHVTRGRPFDGEGGWLRCLPWVGAGLLACVFLPLLPDWPSTGDLLALALIPVIVGSALLVNWERLPTWAQAIPPLLTFVMVALVRSSHESVTATYTPVVLLPVIWFAFYGTRGQLLVSVLCLGITLAIPAPSFEGYPALEPLAAAFWMGVAGITGFAINELVRQRERLQSQLGAMARTDALTDLPNRRAWDEALERELAMAGRTGAPVSIALLDLDHFKEFNDLNGHPAGDTHLKDAAILWGARLRSTDMIARYGGEEFAVLLTATDAHDAHSVMESLRACVPSGQTVSAGVAQWDGEESGAELLVRTDRALYEAKRKGRNRTIAIHAPRFAPVELEPEPEPA
jgi:diguanylate cyclase (GGDEF)-like protein